ncbi:MAG: hypothetical protein KIG36_07355 [Eubacteriales bacterium]|nr:hypothetical protein [Eubacteriales bacterium]
MFFSKNSELNGAWEEKGVIGTRLEIDEPNLLVLWRNTPVLKTRFKRKKDGAAVELVLANKGMRYPQAYSDYAQLKSLIYRDGKLEMTEEFPITGESRATLSKTDNTRFGAYDIADELLPQLRGTWKDEKEWFTVTFEGDKMIHNGHDTRIHILRSRYDGRLLVADQDPSHYELEGISRFEYDGTTLRANLLICDAPPTYVVLTKK